MKFNLKKVIASVAALAMSLSCFTAFAADFSDVEATASYKNAIDTLVALEVVNGYEDGTFKPEAEITRAEVTKMVVAAMGPSYTAAAESSVGASEFTDVKGHWAAGYISVGVAQKFINGMGDGTFAPDANVTYAQIVKMLVAALGYESAAAIAGGYPNGYLSQANKLGITDGLGSVAADTNVTRAQVAQLIYNSLDIPLVIVADWTTNQLTGEPVAVMKVQNGKDDQDYATLLTTFHDAYVVKGRVQNTKATDPDLKAGMVEFLIEYADNYDDKAYDIDATTPTSLAEDVYVGDTNADELLFTYAKAIIKINEDEDPVFVSIVPYGKNEIVEVAADDFYSDAYATSGDFNLTELQFDKEGTTKKEKFPIADTVKMYVNGVLVADGGDSDPIVDGGDVDSYIDGNEIGTVTLINTPQSGTSLDKKFDVIMVTKPLWAVVEETFSSESENKIIFSNVEDASIKAVVSMDKEDEDAVYTFVKNGEEATFEDIKPGDIALLTFDFINKTAGGAAPAATNAIAFELCDTVVEGQVTGKSSDGKYTINGEQYELLTGLSALTVGNEYSLNLDAAGRVIKVKKLASAVNYGIIDKVNTPSGEDYSKVRIIKADGTRESVVIKKKLTINGTADKTATDLYNAVYTTGTLAAPGSIKGAASRMVTYKINSNKEVSEVNFVAGTPTGQKPYKESTNKFDSYKIGEATVIIDATNAGLTELNAVSYAASDIKVGSLETFIDGEEYNVIVADKDSDYGYYKFAVVVTGNNTINVASTIAIVDSVDKAIDEADGEVKTTITVLDAESKGELVTYFVDEEVKNDTYWDDENDNDVEDEGEIIAYDLSDFARGTVVVLGVKDGVVVAYEKLFDGFATDTDIPHSSLGSMFAALGAGNDKDGNPGDSFFRNSFVDAWEDSDDDSANGYARVGFGMIIGKNDNGTEVKFATGTAAGGYDKNNGRAFTKATGIEEFSIAADVNVYVIDNSYPADKEASGYLSMGTVASIIKTPTVKEVEAYTRTGEGTELDPYVYTTPVDIISVTDVTNANYAYFKVIDGDITDIVVFLPSAN